MDSNSQSNSTPVTNQETAADQPYRSARGDRSSSFPPLPPELPDPEQLSGQIAEQVNFALALFDRLGAGMNGVVEDAVYQLGQSALETAAEMTEELAKTIATLSHSASEMGKSTFDWASQMGETTMRQSHKMIDQTLEGTGRAVEMVARMPQLRQWSSFLKIDWLLDLLDRVDVQKSIEAVRSLEQQYPNESPSQIAHHLMVEKAIYAGGMGFAKSMTPGGIAALLAVDLAATTALQAEMVYQIAAAYGLDLRDPARKGEVLAIFGLALGGGQAMQMGLGMLRRVPMAGAIVGASTNAAMMYALGYAACRFYEAKLDTDKLPTETLDALKQESDRYLVDVAFSQQAVMDQILVHMIVACYPQQEWEAILPRLAALQLSQDSLEAIAAQIQSPQPLDALLNQLNRDYAMPLLAQCYRIAQVDGTQSPAETQILETIASRFSLSLEDVKRIIEES